MIPIVGALLGTLAENGLTLLSSAIQAKGKQIVDRLALGLRAAHRQAPHLSGNDCNTDTHRGPISDKSFGISRSRSKALSDKYLRP